MNKEKKEKMKKAAGNAAKIVGAASVGAGSVVAAEAWQNMDAMPDEETDVIDGNGNAGSEETQETGEPEVFNVEDIMIDVENETATVGGDHTEEPGLTEEGPMVAVVEPQPITDSPEPIVPQTDVAEVEPVIDGHIEDIAGYYPSDETEGIDIDLCGTPAPESDQLADNGDIIDPLSDLLA